MTSVGTEVRSLPNAQQPPPMAALHVNPGLWYLWAWFVLLFSLCLMIAVGVFNRLDPLLPLQISFIGLLATVSAVCVVITRAPAVWEADDLGVRRRRGGRMRDELPWDRVKEVRYGTRFRATIGGWFNAYYALAHFLIIRDKRLLHTLFVDSVYRTVDLAEFASFSGCVSRIAESRGIPVVREEDDRRHLAR